MPFKPATHSLKNLLATNASEARIVNQTVNLVWEREKAGWRQPSACVPPMPDSALAQSAVRDSTTAVIL